MKLKLFAAVLVLVLTGFLLYPVLARNLERSACEDNLKQIGRSLLMYQADHDQRFPPRDVWMEAAGEYYTKKEELHCPGVQEPENGRIYGYCFNGRLSMERPSGAPETTELVFDSLNQARNASGPTGTWPSKPRHGVNYAVYADGHVGEAGR